MLVPRWAEAGRRPFLIAYDAEIVPEGDVELEQWVWAESKVPANPDRPVTYWLWMSPVVGITNHLELALPVQFVATSGATFLDSIFAEVRYRIFSRERDSGFQPLIRVAYRHAVRGPPSRVEVNLVGSYGRPTELHLTLDIGASIAGPWPEVSRRPFIATYAAGASYPLFSNELQIAVEANGRFGIHDTSSLAFPRHSLGGAIAWARGRTWITAGCLFGLTDWAAASPRFLPRLNWGIAF